MPGLQLRRRVPPRSAGPAPFAHLEVLVIILTCPMCGAHFGADGRPPVAYDRDTGERRDVCSRCRDLIAEVHASFPNDRSSEGDTGRDQGGEPIDWMAVVLVGVLIALAIFGVLYVRV